jgi:hypothetical protein
LENIRNTDPEEHGEIKSEEIMEMLIFIVILVNSVQYDDSGIQNNNFALVWQGCEM